MPSIAQFGRLAYPMRVKVTTRVLLGRRSHRRRRGVGPATVGAVRVASKTGGLKVTNDNGPEIEVPHETAFSGDSQLPTHRRRVGKADAEREEMGKCTARTAGVQVQASRERYAEITSGKTISQQGLAATCKDPLYKAEAEVSGRDLVWRMSEYERRRRGNALRGDAGRHHGEGNTRAMQRRSGHLAGIVHCTGEGHRAHKPRCGGRVESSSKPTTSGVYAGQRLSLAIAGKARQESQGQNRTRENRPSGIAGRPQETWSTGAGMRPMSKGMDKPPDPTGARAWVLSRHNYATDISPWL